MNFTNKNLSKKGEEPTSKEYTTYIKETVLNVYTPYKENVNMVNASKKRLLSSIENQAISKIISTEELSNLVENTINNVAKINNGIKTTVIGELNFYKEFYINQIKQAEQTTNNEIIIDCKNSLLKIAYSAQEQADYFNLYCHPTINLTSQPSLLSKEEIEWVTDNNIEFNFEQVNLMGDEA